MTQSEYGAAAPVQPHARYILPSFIEHSSFGVKESNPYNKLFEERIIFLGVQVDDASANDIMAQLLVLESLDPDRDITMYINSPGGSFTSLMAIYDTMQYVRADIQTVCLGQAASAAGPRGGSAFAMLALGAECPCADPPAGRRRGDSGSGLRPGDPGRRDRAHAHPDGHHPGPAYRQGSRGHPQGHRPG